MLSSLLHFLQTFLRPNQNFEPQQSLVKIAAPPVPPPVNDINEEQEIRVSSDSDNIIWSHLHLLALRTFTATSAYDIISFYYNSISAYS